jgi:hypothetical protein
MPGLPLFFRTRLTPKAVLALDDEFHEFHQVVDS